jgi:hypothetical protein
MMRILPDPDPQHWVGVLMQNFLVFPDFDAAHAVIGIRDDTLQCEPLLLNFWGVP